MVVGAAACTWTYIRVEISTCVRKKNYSLQIETFTSLHGKNCRIRIFSSSAMWYGVCIYHVWSTPECTWMQKERKLNVPRTDPQIRELSGNDFNLAREPRTDRIVENKDSSVIKKYELILIICKNFNVNVGSVKYCVQWIRLDPQSSRCMKSTSSCQRPCEQTARCPSRTGAFTTLFVGFLNGCISKQQGLERAITPSIW